MCEYVEYFSCIFQAKIMQRVQHENEMIILKRQKKPMKVEPVILNGYNITFANNMFTLLKN